MAKKKPFFTLSVSDSVDVTVKLPETSNASDIDIDATASTLNLSAGSYCLEITFPVDVDEDDCTARFDKGTNMLVVSFPVLNPPTSDEPVVIEGPRARQFLDEEVLEVVAQHLPLKERFRGESVSTSWRKELRHQRWRGEVDITTTILTKNHRPEIGPILAAIIKEGVQAGANFAEEGRITIEERCFDAWGGTTKS